MYIWAVPGSMGGPGSWTGSGQLPAQRGAPDPGQGLGSSLGLITVLPQYKQEAIIHHIQFPLVFSRNAQGLCQRLNEHPPRTCSPQPGTSLSCPSAGLELENLQWGISAGPSSGACSYSAQPGVLVGDQFSLALHHHKHQ